MSDALEGIRGAALDAVAESLREIFAVQRCTLRINVAGDLLPVLHESRVPPAESLMGAPRVPLRGQPVAEAMLAGVPQVVQPDTRTASADPAFQSMLEAYGGMGAQIVTAARSGDRLLAVISLHQLGGPREWTDAETALARDAADLVARILDGPAPGG